MFGKILAWMGFTPNTTSVIQDSRRKHTRHPGFNAHVLINGSRYSVHDWSMGGVATEPIVGSGLEIGDKVKVELQFNISGSTITITQDAHIVRSNYGSAAAEFEPLPPIVKAEFERVLETLYTQSFVESQAH